MEEIVRDIVHNLFHIVWLLGVLFLSRWLGFFEAFDFPRPSKIQALGLALLFMGTRDHGWNCESEIEAAHIARALRKIGLTPEVRHG